MSESKLTEDEEERIFMRVMLGEMGHMAKILTGPDKEISRDELIAMLAESSARMVRAGVHIAYAEGYKAASGG